MRASTLHRIRRWHLAAFSIVVVAAILVGTLWSHGASDGASQDDNPFLVRGPFVDPASPATAAARAGDGSLDDADRGRLRQLGAVPTAIWLVPEATGADAVKARVRALVKEATAADEELVLVVYGIADRDCGGYSSGGLSGGAYQSWVEQIAAGADGGHVSVVLEPDALALLDQCGDSDARVATMKRAVGTLVGRGIVTYVDAGHSSWVAPSTMATRLREVGVGDARGFATNVANYNTDADERSYADQVSSALGGSHYVIDSGRNGSGSDGQFCNPPGRSLGTKPGFVDDGSAQDAYLWIKPPGESDGDCGGGPSAGTWWIAGALDLTRNTGW